MKKRKLGTTDLYVTPVAFGVLTMGGSQMDLPLQEGAELIRYAIDKGINFFDTARAYTDSEEKLGAAFGPLMLFSLFWKRTARAGAIAGMVAGGAMVFFWRGVLKPMGGVWGIYELLPAFLFSALVIVVVSLLTRKPSADMDSEFDRIKAGQV